MSLDHAAASTYLTRLVAVTLARRGFTGGEAGALAEIEHMLEHHIRQVFEESMAYANLAGRAHASALDLVAVYDTHRLRRESKRKRAAIKLNRAPPADEPPAIETLSALMDDSKEFMRAPPEFAFEGAPVLPDKWTYRTEPANEPAPPAAPATSGIYDFIKLTATERGDIPPELGLVDYRRTGKARRWGVKGVGA
ncbi:hypothetical protein Q5752_002595 [Cryptotrichosporon argae]